MPHTEVKMNDELTVRELLDSDLTRLAMVSDRVEKNYVETILTAAKNVRGNRAVSR